MDYYCEAFAEKDIDKTRFLFRDNEENRAFEHYSIPDKQWIKNHDLGRRLYDGGIDAIKISEEKAFELINKLTNNR